MKELTVLLIVFGLSVFLLFGAMGIGAYYAERKRLALQKVHTIRKQKYG